MCPDAACPGRFVKRKLRRQSDHQRGTAMQPARDPSSSSYYVTDAFYRDLVAQFADWQRDDLAVADAAERDRFRMLIEQEARLLDQLRFDEWLAMYAPECIYWLPSTPEIGDPRREVSISLEHSSRMWDRFERLIHGFD